MSTPMPGGTLTLGEDLTLTRMGYGAMQLAGRGVWGPPRDRGEAILVLRTAVESGITHIDTSDYYGPHTVNEVIREALHPYPANLRIVTKVGARRGTGGSWLPAHSPAELTSAVHDNLRNLDVDALDIVNLRAGDVQGPGAIAEGFAVLAGLRQQGLIRHLGLSNVTAEHLTAAQAVAPVVCVQNLYNVATRADDALVDRCARTNIAYVPFFPLGGLSPLHSAILDDVARRLGASPMQVALAWLLQRSPTMLLIPGTSSVAHLGENLAAAALELPLDAVDQLNKVAG